MKKPQLLRLAGLHREKKQLEVEKELEGTPIKLYGCLLTMQSSMPQNW